MLKPKRLNGSPLARRKTVKWELERRFPARYTASNSLRRTSRTSRGNFWLGPLGGVAGPSALLGCKTMTALLAARGKHFAATLGLHARTKPVRLGAPALSRLKCTLWQSNPPLRSGYGSRTPRVSPLRRRFAARSQSESRWPWGRVRQALLPDFRQLSEFTSVLATRAGGQENPGVAGVAYGQGKSDTPALRKRRLKNQLRLSSFIAVCFVELSMDQRSRR